MSKRFTEEFRREAVRQIKEHGHRVAEVSERLGVSTSTHSLYQWIKRYSARRGAPPAAEQYQAICSPGAAPSNTDTAPGCGDTAGETTSRSARRAGPNPR